MFKKGILLILSALSTTVFAETMYISDQLSVDMRSGPTNEYRFLGRLESGAKVEVIETDTENKTSKIKTQRGNEVWVRTRFLMKEPSAREQLVDLQTSFRQLENQYRQEISELKNQIAETQDVQKHNQELVLENTKLEQQLELVNQQNTRLADRSNTDFMKIGAGILVIGMIVGWIITKLGGGKRRSSWN